MSLAQLAPAGLATDTFRLLFVCSANVRLSVMAERLARHALLVRRDGVGLRFRVSSAGLRAVSGARPDPYAAAALTRLGANVCRFGARRLSPELLREADLVLTANRRQRGGVVVMLPAASRKVFTLREFARVAAHLPGDEDAPAGAGVADRARWVVGTVAQLRGQVGVVAAPRDDIEDPAHRPGAFRSCAKGISVAVAAAVDALCPAG